MAIVLKKTSLIFVTLLVVASVVSGCGRRGPPEAPPAEARVVQTDENGNIINEPEPAADKPFVLDALL